MYRSLCRTPKCRHDSAQWDPVETVPICCPRVTRSPFFTVVSSGS
jgi:hypothetical protein